MRFSCSWSFHIAAVSQVLSFLVFPFFSKGTLGVTFTVVNECGFTVWPGISGYPLLNLTGFELTNGASRSFEAPPDWVGRIWGRTGCNSNWPGWWQCLTGDCGTGQMECGGIPSTPPTTIAEFNFNQTQGRGSYDVSIFDGYNLPILVEAMNGSGSGLHSCAKTGCVDDLLQRCPTELLSSLKLECITACQAFRSREYCCSSSLSSCKSTVYDQLFKSACPRSYDQSKKFMCTGADYFVRFCPAVDSFSTIKRGGRLDSTDQLVSIRGNFTLGFFDKDYSYLGIWYTDDLKATKVWVANQDMPILSTSGAHALSINPKTGDLIIIAEGRTLMTLQEKRAIATTNVVTIATKVVAVDSKQGQVVTIAFVAKGSCQ